MNVLVLGVALQAHQVCAEAIVIPSVPLEEGDEVVGRKRRK